jgi:hypothetical protein
MRRHALRLDDMRMNGARRAFATMKGMRRGMSVPEAGSKDDGLKGACDIEA